MLRVVGSLAQEHDLTLVLLAILVCLLATSTSTRLLSRGAGRQDDHGTAWMSVAALTFSLGVWTTHFLGMLAFVPGIPTTIDATLSVLSLALVVLPAQIAFSIWARHPAFVLAARRSSGGGWGAGANGPRDSWGTAIVVGLLIDGGIAMMHFVGMRSLLMPAHTHHDMSIVLAALGLGGLLSVAATRVLEPRRVNLAALLLAGAVLTVHFGGMAAMTVEPVRAAAGAQLVFSHAALAVATGGGCVVLLVLALLAFRLDRHMSLRLATEALRFRNLADATFEGLIFERACRIVDTNRALCRLLGADAPSLVGRPIASVISGGVSMHPSSPERPMEYELIQQDGGTRPVEVLWRNGPDPGGHVMAIRDISREKTAQLEIHHLAHFDALTGVGNRQLLDQTLQKIVAMPERLASGVALHCVGLDRLKAINDTLGSRTGDAVLAQAARRLSGLLRDGDTIARLGGDEFAVIQLLNGQPAEAAALAERMVAALAEPYEVEGRMVSTTGSVGVALFPGDGSTTLALMTSGALALGRAKQDGRNTWRYCEPGKDYLLRERRALESDMRGALVDGQFCLAYQPFFHGGTLEIAGYEALLRWDHPTRGRISPADFIPIAEECGLIVPIGQWVLQTACATAAGWDRRLTIAVNLSPAQFGPGIAGTVDAVLRETGLSPSLLELEITEGVLIGDTQNALKTLTALKALGITLAMDDFGTGYSSLSYLKKFPFDKLKIDRSFIRDMDDDADSRPIVQAIIALSRSLRLKVTAEGVETPDQLALLRAEGCTFVQGFLLGRPMSARQLEHRDASAGRPPGPAGHLSVISTSGGGDKSVHQLRA